MPIGLQAWAHKSHRALNSSARSTASHHTRYDAQQPRRQTTKKTIKQAADTILDYSVNRAGGTPGVAAMATDHKANFYEGSAGKRALGGEPAMTLDSVMAIFSTTKATTGRALMLLVIEGKVRLAGSHRGATTRQAPGRGDEREYFHVLGYAGHCVHHD